MSNYLTVTDHNREIQGFTYIYPVVSRRAGGVSIGINLNINNACNWRCIYCQVPNLSRGTPPEVDMLVLETELRATLDEVLHGNFMQQYVSEEYRILKDIAFSGNGEPTSAKQFPQVIHLLEKILEEYKLLHQIKVRLITNGSLIHKPAILKSLLQLKQINGEVWFKLDRGTKEEIGQVNDVNLDPTAHLKHLKLCASHCPTWVQTCMFAFKNQAPTEAQCLAYLDCISSVKDMIQGVYLYGVARPSYQPEAQDISQLPITWLENLAERIRAMGLTVYVSP
ncbi:MAG: radical SAM protein [Methylophilus sp.]|nr:radical SAM protein [Methylophilus sp.]